MSLLDRALITLDEKNEVDLKTAQKIFGNFDKSQLIDILKLILQGEEKKVIETYREIYDQGLEPKIFINDFLELVYYLKNIESLTLESTNFSLNDEEFSQIFFEQRLSSKPFLQFKDFATILAIVVFPIPLIPVNK